MRSLGRLPLIELWATGGPAVEGTILPDGCMDLVTDGDRIVVAGADSRARHFIPQGNNVPMWGARFHPGVLPSLLGVPAHHVTDQVVDLSDLVPLTLHPDDLLDDRLLSRALPLERLDAMPLRVASQLQRGHDVEGIARSAGWSARQLRRLSADWFGYGPKRLQRVLRVRRAEALLSRGLSKAEVAAACGYADASHLWRDRKELTSPAC